MRLNFIEINQPIGTFYIVKISAEKLLQLSVITRRIDSSIGIQRDLAHGRVNEIAQYCQSPDATFPTSIIVCVNSCDVKLLDGNVLEIDDSKREIFEILDGQHRLLGISKSNSVYKFELPIVLMFDLTEEEKAYVFSIINSKQTKVSMSLIYDLFELSEKRSPQKTAHELARALNQMPDSPFYNRLKMLGKKMANQEVASLSQGTFVKNVLTLISKKPEKDTWDIKRGISLEQDYSLPLRQYFINGKDDVILKILLNCFSALKIVFNEEWLNCMDNVLWKTTGFGAVIKSFPVLYSIGVKQHKLTIDFFKACFENFKINLREDNKNLGTDFSGGGNQLQSQLSEYILKNLDEIFL